MRQKVHLSLSLASLKDHVEKAREIARDVDEPQIEADLNWIGILLEKAYLSIKRKRG